MNHDVVRALKRTTVPFQPYSASIHELSLPAQRRTDLRGGPVCSTYSCYRGRSAHNRGQGISMQGREALATFRYHGFDTCSVHLVVAMLVVALLVRRPLHVRNSNARFTNSKVNVSMIIIISISSSINIIGIISISLPRSSPPGALLASDGCWELRTECGRRRRMYVCLCMYIYIYIYIYMGDIYIYVYIYICIYIYI